MGAYYFKVGFKNDGKITAVQLHYIGPCLIGNNVGKLHQASSIPHIQCTQSVPIKIGALPVLREQERRNAPW